MSSYHPSQHIKFLECMCVKTAAGSVEGEGSVLKAKISGQAGLFASPVGEGFVHRPCDDDDPTCELFCEDTIPAGGGGDAAAHPAVHPG